MLLPTMAFNLIDSPPTSFISYVGWSMWAVGFRVRENNFWYTTPTHSVFGTVKYIASSFYHTKNKVRGFCVGGHITMFTLKKLGFSSLNLRLKVAFFELWWALLSRR